MLAATAKVHAGLVHGSLDPDFGGPFPNLGWRATFDLFVSNSCLSAVGTGHLDYTNFGTISDCATSQFQNVELFFYNSGDPGKTTVESFLLGDFGASLSAGTYGSLDETQALIGVDISDGSVTGFDSSASFRVTANSAIAGGGSADFSLVLSNDSNIANLYDLPYGSEQSVKDASDNGQFSGTRPYVTFVPEPGSIALVALALAGLASTRRRER